VQPPSPAVSPRVAHRESAPPRIRHSRARALGRTCLQGTMRRSWRARAPTPTQSDRAGSRSSACCRAGCPASPPSPARTVGTSRSPWSRRTPHRGTGRMPPAPAPAGACRKGKASKCRWLKRQVSLHCPHGLQGRRHSLPSRAQLSAARQHTPRSARSPAPAGACRWDTIGTVRAVFAEKAAPM